MANTLFYFFSTLAQTFAALVALAYVAAQVRIAWLDGKITGSKRHLLQALHAGSPRIEEYMHTKPATLVMAEGLTSPNPNAQSLAQHLKTDISRIQNVRKDIRINILAGLLVTALAIIGIAATPLLDKSEGLAWTSIAVVGTLALVALFAIGKYSYESMRVSLVEPIL